MGNITEHLSQIRGGHPAARDQLFSAAYPELRKLARSRLRGGGRNTYLQTTALVHESYLKLIGGVQLRDVDRHAFFAYAARVMRSVIIDAVREKRAERRGGGSAIELTLDTNLSDALPSGEWQVLQVHEALLALETIEPRLASVVEMKYFGGYSELEIADSLGLTDRTVRRYWEKARLLLLALLRS